MKHIQFVHFHYGIFLDGIEHVSTHGKFQLNYHTNLSRSVGLNEGCREI